MKKLIPIYILLIAIILSIIYYYKQIKNLIYEKFSEEDSELEEILNDYEGNINFLSSEINKSTEDDNLNTIYNNKYFPFNDLYYDFKNKIDKYIFDKKNKIHKDKCNQETKLLSIKNKLTNLKRNINSSFDSIFENNIIKLKKYSSDNELDNNNFLRAKKYLDDNGEITFQIFTNGQNNECLEVDDKGFFKSATCNYNINENSKQRFKLKIIYSKNNYESIVKNPNFRQPENINLIKFPIIIIMDDNNNCINLNNNKLIIEPCKYKKSQMFILDNLI